MAAPAAIQQTNIGSQAFAKAKEIVGTVTTAVSSATGFSFAPSTGTGSSIGSVSTAPSFFSTEGGTTLLGSIYYLVLFIFSIFVILMIVNYTIKPIFSLSPGQPGIISLPGAQDNEIYWTSSYPASNDARPRGLDKLTNLNLGSSETTLSVDVYLPGLSGISIYKRILFFKGKRELNNSSSGIWSSYPATSEVRSTLEALREKVRTLPISMIAYIDESNKLMVDFFDQTNSPITLGPIDNVPTDKPFRITITQQEKLLELYLNGKLAQSRALSTPITPPISVTGNQAVYPSPVEWRTSSISVTTTSCAGGANSGIGIKVLNLHIWPRAISAPEVAAISPSLPSTQQFDALNKTDAVPPVQQETIGTGSLNQTASCPPQGKGNSLTLDTKSTLLILGTLAAVVYLFKNNQPSQ